MQRPCAARIWRHGWAPTRGHSSFTAARHAWVVPDNLKSGVTKSCWYEPGLNASYQELARWYSLGILPARPYRPKDKGAVEAGVQVAEHWILAPLRKRRSCSAMATFSSP